VSEPRLTVVTLGVRDLPRSVRFYADAFGFSPAAGSNEHIAFFDANGVVLALYGWNALAEDAHVSPEGSGFRGVGLARNVADPASVDALVARAVAAGATLAKPAQKVFWGGYSGYVADPDGHLWEIAHNPHWTLHEGRVRLGG
jgi:catechol 2,3-dioxygenase-like lactoylglutathione lyase family enzyme